MTYPDQNPHSGPPPQPGSGGPDPAGPAPQHPAGQAAGPYPGAAGWSAPAAGGQGIDLGAVPPAPPPAAKRRGRMIAVIAGAAAVLLLGTGGAFAVAKFKNMISQAEGAVPGSTVAFARIDLSPGLGQMAKVAALAKKFPQKGGATSGDDLRYDMIDEIAPGMSRAEVDGWLGERLGVGAWQDGSKPVALIAIASKDDAKARTALARSRTKVGDDELGYVVVGKWALIARAEKGAQASAEAAAKAARKESLADSKKFSTAVDGLPAGQIVVGWADLGGVRSMMERYAADLDAAEREMAVKSLASVKGQIVMGVQATDSGVELRARSTGTDVDGATDVRPRLESMPADTRVGLALSGGGYLNQGIDEAFGAIPANQLPAGLKDAVKKITSFSFVLDRFGSALPGMALDVRTSDAAAARALADAIRPLASSGGVKVTTAADGLQITTPEHQRGSGRLGDSARYREVMAGMPTTLYYGAFADVEKLLAEPSIPVGARQGAGPIKAVGLGVGPDGDGQLTLVRVLIP